MREYCGASCVIAPRDWNIVGAPPVAGREGVGAIYSEKDELRIVAPNLTPDTKTGIGSWTDDMLARAIREGVGHDGRVLRTAMQYQSFLLLAQLGAEPYPGALLVAS